MVKRRSVARLVAIAAASICVSAQSRRTPDWPSITSEILTHFQALLRFDTSNPPGNEKVAADYVQGVLEKEGIEVQRFALEPSRPNIVARIKGNGSKRPILLMGHTDVVTVDPTKWKFPPFSATREGGYIYGRGSLDDKPDVVSAMMTMVLLKRLSVPLDRDVIFLAEAGEEGTSHVGAAFMTARHPDAIDAEFCFAETGGVTRIAGQPRYATVETAEKLPRTIELTARGTSGHGSRPLQDNAIVHLSQAVAAVGRWRTPAQLNETTREYFGRLAAVSAGDAAQRYRAVLRPDSAEGRAADAYFAAKEPNHASMLRTSISPTMISGGFRFNVIPSEAKATLDVRMLPGESPEVFLGAMRKTIDDPAVQADFVDLLDPFPPARPSSLGSDAFKAIEAEMTKHYHVPTIPMMGTGATDMAFMRARGSDCYGIGPATDVEDGPRGFGAHSDQERILEDELYRYVQFEWDVVTDLAASR